MALTMTAAAERVLGKQNLGAEPSVRWMAEGLAAPWAEQRNLRQAADDLTPLHFSNSVVLMVRHREELECPT